MRVDQIEGCTDFRVNELPMARIKKVMKADDDVKKMVRPAHGQAGARRARWARMHGADWRPPFEAGTESASARQMISSEARRQRRTREGGAGAADPRGACGADGH